LQHFFEFCLLWSHALKTIAGLIAIERCTGLDGSSMFHISGRINCTVWATGSTVAYVPQPHCSSCNRPEEQGFTQEAGRNLIRALQVLLPATGSM